VGTIDRAYDEKRRKQDEKVHAENRADKAVTSHRQPAHPELLTMDGNL